MAYDPTATNQEYDAARTRALQGVNNQNASSQDAIKRRYAATGNLNTGAYQKAAQIQDDSSNQAKDNVTGQLNLEQAKTNRDLSFKEGEAEKGRAFSSGEAQKQRDFQGTQFNTEMDFKKGVQAFDQSAKLRQLDQMDKEFSLKQDESEFNKRAEKYKAGQSGGLFGGGGFLGTGIGAKPADF